MTIASEISRLQTAKVCIRNSIINKGLDVPANLTLDEYYCCIDALCVVIPKIVDFLLIG